MHGTRQRYAWQSSQGHILPCGKPSRWLSCDAWSERIKTIKKANKTRAPKLFIGFLWQPLDQCGWPNHVSPSFLIVTCLLWAEEDHGMELETSGWFDGSLWQEGYRGYLVHNSPRRGWLEDKSEVSVRLSVTLAALIYNPVHKHSMSPALRVRRYFRIVFFQRFLDAFTQARLAGKTAIQVYVRTPEYLSRYSGYYTLYTGPYDLKRAGTPVMATSLRINKNKKKRWFRLKEKSKCSISYRRF